MKLLLKDNKGDINHDSRFLLSYSGINLPGIDLINYSSTDSYDHIENEVELTEDQQELMMEKMYPMLSNRIFCDIVCRNSSGEKDSAIMFGRYYYACPELMEKIFLDYMEIRIFYTPAFQSIVQRMKKGMHGAIYIAELLQDKSVTVEGFSTDLGALISGFLFHRNVSRVVAEQITSRAVSIPSNISLSSYVGRFFGSIGSCVTDKENQYSIDDEIVRERTIKASGFTSTSHS